MFRLSEMYPAVQGEGPHVGEKTIFCRFGGCNLRCALWPCDSPYAIYPGEFRHEWRRVEPVDLARELLEMAEEHNINNISLTGGEPFLQHTEDLHTLVDLIFKSDRTMTIDIFSNGTILYPEWVKNPKIHFIMDWKLPGSGEDPYNQNRYKNLDTIKDNGSVKFVCANLFDFTVANDLYLRYLQDTDIPVYYGVAWGKMENSELVNLVMECKVPWRLNVQVHNYVFDRTQRGI